MSPELHDRIAEIYATADAAVAAAGPVCESSGRCCRFTEYGHTLFLCDMEAEYLLATAPAYDAVSVDGCPFQIEGLCTARDERPLGCRVYFCDPKFQATMPVILEEHLAKLKQLASDFERPWRYAPLQTFLQEALDAGRMVKVESSARKSLPMAS